MVSSIEKRFWRWQQIGVKSFNTNVPRHKSGEFHLEFLMSRGLLPYHSFLDIGCGALRTGLNVIPYLNKGNYYGFDKEGELIGLASQYIISMYNLAEKRPMLAISDQIPFSSDMKFNFMWAHSVFSHLKPEDVKTLLMEVSLCLKEGGKFFATFHEGERIDVGRKHVWRTHGEEFERVEYPFSFFQDMAARFGLKAELLGHWRHESCRPDRPVTDQAQKMMEFRLAE